MRLVSIALLLTLAAGCAQQKDLQALEARVKAAEDKVAALEATPGRAKPAAPAASPEDEASATQIMTDLQAATKENNYPLAKEKLAELTSKYPTTRAGKAAARMGSEINLVGTDAAPITVDKWFMGKASLDDSKATLLVFWEVWCPHCKKELPTLPARQAKFKSKGLQIVALTKVNKTSTDEKVEEFLKEAKSDFPVGKETADGAMSKAYAVSGIPAAALVMGGKVVWRGHPAKLTDEMLDQFLGS